MPDDLSALAPIARPPPPLRSMVIAALRTAIETGTLAPGTRLVEKDLCEHLGVSRTCLRESLRELEAGGILEHGPGRSMSVAVISRTEAENVYRIRAVLEALVVQQFIEKAGDAELGRLQAEADALTDAYRSGELTRMLTCKRAFYDRICSGAGNSVAFDIINRLVLRTAALRGRSMQRPERQAESVNEIEALMAATTRRDVQAARAAATRHVLNSARSSLGVELA